MFGPILERLPTLFPVTLGELKPFLSVDFDDHDTLITGLIQTATAHFDGLTGILGRAIMAQTWQQSFSAFPERFCSQQCRQGPISDQNRYKNAGGRSLRAQGVPKQHRPIIQKCQL